MYLSFFGLGEKPFALTPNTAFLVRLAPYQACLNLLRVALGEGEGFIKVSGEVGTGKTLLCRALLNALSEDDGRWQVAWLPNPGLSPRDLRQALAHELRIADAEHLDDHSLLAALNQRLIELAAEGKRTVLLIDEAQALPPKTLEALRLLTNLETEHCKLLQVVLFGQPELDAVLEQPEFRQLRQRITFSYRLLEHGVQLRLA
ncbi:MAG TPA: AAA family ATPase, partial [Pseudomonas sp.]